MNQKSKRVFKDYSDLKLTNILWSLEKSIYFGEEAMSEEKKKKIYFVRSFILEEIIFRSQKKVSKTKDLEQPLLELLMQKINHPRLQEIVTSDLKEDTSEAAKLLIARIEAHLKSNT